MMALSLIFVAAMLVLAMHWQLRKFGQVTYEQILFHMNISLDSETKLLESFLQNTLLPAAILIAVLALVFGLTYKCPGWWLRTKDKCCCWQKRLAALVFLVSLAYVAVKLDISEIIEDYKASSIVSDFYEKHYQAPQEAEIIAPEHKRNLVLVFLESAESTFMKPKYRKYYKHDFMPELRVLAEENLNFSDDKDDIGGSMQVDGAQWTQAGLVAQTCGIPLHLPITNHNKFLPKHGYLPKAWCLFDILKQQGYKQSFLTGMEKSYAGVNKFFKTHGRVKVLSWKKWKKKYGLSDRHDAVRKRILRDEGLYQEAKIELTRLAKSGKPFALTLMTMDSHSGNEFLDEENCGSEYSERYQNVYRCTSKKIGQFVNWIKQQPFYKDTTIVIVNDHLVMNDSLFDEDMERRNLNIIINGVPEPKNNRGRQFTSFDMYPTIVESLGFDVADDKLGLGISLYGGKKTLPEQGFDTEGELENELSKRSHLYEELLYGKAL